MNGCIFCRIAAGEAPSWRVLETEHALAFLDLQPVSEYHTLVIPRRHVRDIFEVPTSELVHVMVALKQVVDRFRERLGIEHVQIVSNSGAAAEQAVFHLHFHVIPRHGGAGQAVTWSPRPELRERFDEMLRRLD